jgi:hypothetical protein
LPARELIEREREGVELEAPKKRAGYHWYHHPSDEPRTIFAEMV